MAMKKISALTPEDVEAIQSNENLFAELVSQNARFINKIVGKFSSGEDSYAELTQEAHLSLWNALGKYDPSRASFSTFAYRVMYNDCLCHVKRGQKYAHDLPLEYNDGSEVEIVSHYESVESIVESSQKMVYNPSEVGYSLVS